MARQVQLPSGIWAGWPRRWHHLCPALQVCGGGGLVAIPRRWGGGAGERCPQACASGGGRPHCQLPAGRPPPCGPPIAPRLHWSSTTGWCSRMHSRRCGFVRGEWAAPPVAPGGTRRQQLATSPGSWQTQRRLARLPPRQPMAGGGRIGEPMQRARLAGPRVTLSVGKRSR